MIDSETYKGLRIYFEQKEDEVVAHVLGRYQASVGTVHCSNKENALFEIKNLIDDFWKRRFPENDT